jgi:hypothetical protein
MTDDGGRNARGHGLSALVLPLATYVAVAGWAAWAYRDWINPDAVAYLRNGLYWTQGRWVDAISGYWSPLFSLCVAPLLAAGRDPLHAGVCVVAVWGALLVVATWRLVLRLDLLPGGLAIAALLLTADATVRWGTTLFPDVILAACLIAAASVLVAPSVLSGRLRPAIAGALGGLSYLGKGYGFPFFIVFLPLTLAAFHGPWVDGDANPGPPARRAWRRLARPWGWGMLGFVLVAAPWVAALSIKLATPTIGSVGKINHAIIGPRDVSRDALWRPVSGRVTVWEIPETRAYGFWSPLESIDTLEWQARYSWANAKRIRNALGQFDWFSLSLVLAVLAPFVALSLHDVALLRFTVWIAGTFAVFASGFVFVYFDYRYTAPFLKPLAIVAVLGVADRLGRKAASSGLATVFARWVRPATVGFALVSFAAHLNLPFAPYIVQEPNGTAFDNVIVDSGPHRALARRLASSGIRGPVASNFYWGGMFTAFWMDAGFVGAPSGRDAVSVRDELKAVGAEAFLVDPAWPIAGSIAADPAWSLAMTTEAAGQPIDVYVRSAGVAPPR